MLVRPANIKETTVCVVEDLTLMFLESNDLFNNRYFGSQLSKFWPVGTKISLAMFWTIK